MRIITNNPGSITCFSDVTMRYVFANHGTVTTLMIAVITLMNEIVNTPPASHISSPAETDIASRLSTSVITIEIVTTARMK